MPASGFSAPAIDLHERRLARPVLAQQRVHRAGADREVHAGQRDDAAVGLPHPLRLEHSAAVGIGAEVLVRVVELLGHLVLEVAAARLRASFWRAMISSMFSLLTISAPEFHMPSGSGLPPCLASAISLIAR